MIRRRQRKIARHKVKRDAKRQALRATPSVEGFVHRATQVKRWEAKRTDAVAALVPDAQAEYTQECERFAQERRTARRAEKRLAVRIDGRRYLTYRGHAVRLALMCMVLLAAAGVLLTHPLAGVAMAAGAPVLFKPVETVLALLGRFPVTFYGAKGDGLDASAAKNTTAFSTAIAAATATSGGTVIVPGATAAYMVTAGGIGAIGPSTEIVGEGRPTIKLVGGANVNSYVFRTTTNRKNWGVRGLILDGNIANVTSTLGGQGGLIVIGRNNDHVRIVDCELANAAYNAILTSTYVAGDTGVQHFWMLNNYIHDVGTNAAFGTLKNALYFSSVKKSVFMGNRVVRSGDDNFAFISEFLDYNGICENNLVVANTFDTSHIASNIALNGHGHICTGNIVTGSGGVSGGVTAGAIRIRPTDGDGAAASLPTNLTGANNDLTFSSKTVGAGGASTSVQYVNPGTNNAALSVGVVGSAITVNLATDAGGAITSTAADVAAAVLASTPAAALVYVGNRTGDNGTGVVTAMAVTNLTQAKTMPWDITLSYNQVTPDPVGGGKAGIYVEGARCDVSHNMVFMSTDASVSTKANLIGIRSETGTQPLDRILPSLSGMNRIENNTIYGGYRGIQHSPGSKTCGRLRIKGNDVTLAYDHGIVLAPTALAADDFIDVSDNYVAGCGGDGIRWSGTWVDGVVSHNIARNCTGYGLNIPSGTMTSTRRHGNVAINCTAGAANLGITVIDY